MRLALRTEPVGESKKVLLIYGVEDFHHGTLDNLVFQRCDAQRPLPPLRVLYIPSPGRWCPIPAPVDSSVEYHQRPPQIVLSILLPYLSVDSWRRFHF